MKQIICFAFVMLSVVLVGCANKPLIMPPLTYDKPINIRLKKNAALYWEQGKQHAATIRTQAGENQGLLGALVFGTMDSMDRSRNPSRYSLAYGTAEQAIFMTSLRNVLDQNQIFDQIELITDPSVLTPKDILITVFFKNSRVLSPDRGHRITLSVVVNILAKGCPNFQRTYLVQSDEQVTPGFIDQQKSVSQLLLGKIISGMEEWHSQVYSQGGRG